MCGIAGSIGTETFGQLSEVDSMVSTMAHRGPDAHGTRVLGACVLGHARLRIIDLSPAGDQPMTNEDETVWVVFNGEIYNHPELRLWLEGRGHVFRSATDTEIIVHLYEEEGPELVHRLRGMFAFAIWDSERQSLTLARDRLGIKPLYYRRSGASLQFSSETRALTTGSSRLDPASVRAYLQLGWVPGPPTIWADISELPPGHRLVWRAGKAEVTRYWSIPPHPEATTSEQLVEALQDSMRRHLVADVPVGLFLSSGVDSSVLAHLLAGAGGRARAFTVAFEGEGGEEHDAGRLAARLGIDHTIARVAGADVRRSLYDIVGALDQPSVDGVNTWVVSDALRRHGMVVALSGVGGDELFGGYSTFRHVPNLVSWAARTRAAPGPAWAYGAGLLNRSPRWAHSRSARAIDAVRSGTWEAAYAAVRGLFPEHDVNALVGPAATPVPVHGPVGAGEGGEVRRLELTNYLPFQLLRDTDAMSMAHSLEVRVPLLDDAVVAAAGRFDKQGFASAVSPDLIEIAGRRKKTFTLPFDSWLRGPLHADIGAAVIGLEELGMDGDHLRALWTAFRRGEVDWRPIWALAVLAMWADRNGAGTQAVGTEPTPSVTTLPAPPPSAAPVGTGRPPRLKVAYVDHCAELSGGELSLLELLEALTTVDAHVVLAGEGPFADRLLDRGISVEILDLDAGAREVSRDRIDRRLPLPALLSIAGYIVRLSLRLRQLRPDLVHTNSLKAAMYGGLAGRLAGIPVVWHVRDQLVATEYPSLARRVVRAMARTVPSAIIANSTSTLALLGDRLPATMVVPSIIVPPRSDGHRRPTRTAGSLRFGIVGRLAPLKGQHVFLTAFAGAFPEGDHRAVVVGTAMFHDQGYEAELHVLADTLGLNGRVEFRGHREHIADELDRLDVFVHASVTPESFGRVIVEAMAAGLPVIASRAGGPMEIVDDEQNGLLVTPGDPAALGAAMRRLAGSEPLRARLAEAAWESAGRFSAARAVDGVMGTYGEALAARRRRSRK